MYCCIVDNGMVFDNEVGVYVEQPTILIDADGDTLIKWGTRSQIEAIYEARKDAYLKLYQDNPQTIRLVCLDILAVDEQCYILNRMINMMLN